jgi:nucleotide-binding universal stress UspA family protein
MKRILIPVDFSKTSENALFYTLALFSKIKVEITVLHTFRLPSTAFHLKSIDHLLWEDAEKDMEKLLEKVAKRFPKMHVKTKIMEGDAEESIIRFSKRKDYDLISMGTKGVSGLKEVFIGSVAGEVISKSHVPVLVIPKSAKEFVAKDITLAVSRYGVSDQVTLQPLRELISITNSNLHILHLTEEENHPLKPRINSLENLHPHYIYTYCEHSIDQCINEYVTKSHSQMLCLIRSNRDFFSRLITGSVTKKQTFHSKVPLLILHDNMD